MNFTLLITALFFVVTNSAEARVLQTMGAADFTANAQTVGADEIQYYYQLSPDAATLDNFKSLDSDQILTSKDKDNYYIQVAKVAYRVKKPVAYFTSERACNEEYLKKLYIDLKIKQLGPCKFKVAADFPAPGFEIDFSSSKNGSTQFQYTHDFTRVMRVKTVHTTSNSISYSAIGEKETLVTVHTLSFIHNLPPAMFGGAGTIKSKFLEQVTKIADRTDEIN